MAVHIGMLPSAVVDALVAKLNEDGDERSSLRFLRLPHPRTGLPSLFLPYTLPTVGTTHILEVQVVEPVNERSWFMSEGQVVDNGRLTMMTPVDPAFLLLPMLLSVHPTDGSPGIFRPSDDILEDAAMKLMHASTANSKDVSNKLHCKDMMHLSSLESVQHAMKRVCEFKEITPEIVVYRYSPAKVVEYMRAKVARLVVSEVFKKSLTVTRNLAKDGLMEDGKEALLESGCQRAACDLLSQYLPAQVYEDLLASYDFTQLSAYFQVLQTERSALAASKLDSIEAKESKSMLNNDNGKKRKGQTKSSTGVEKLKKANVKGMSKISSFFQKPAP